MNVKTNQQTRMERILQKKLTVFKNEKKSISAIMYSFKALIFLRTLFGLNHLNVILLN